PRRQAWRAAVATAPQPRLRCAQRLGVLPHAAPPDRAAGRVRTPPPELVRRARGRAAAAAGDLARGSRPRAPARGRVSRWRDGGLDLQALARLATHVLQPL